MVQTTTTNTETPATDRLSLIFSALADPTRRAILDRLRQGEATVNELASPFQLSLPAVSKHIKVLEKAGLISRKKQAQWRPCALEMSTFQEAVDWINHYVWIWENSLNGLDNYLRNHVEQPVSGTEGERE